jgi:hypothetical protein
MASMMSSHSGVTPAGEQESPGLHDSRLAGLLLELAHIQAIHPVRLIERIHDRLADSTVNCRLRHAESCNVDPGLASYAGMGDAATGLPVHAGHA